MCGCGAEPCFPLSLMLMVKSPLVDRFRTALFTAPCAPAGSLYLTVVVPEAVHADAGRSNSWLDETSPVAEMKSVAPWAVIAATSSVSFDWISRAVTVIFRRSGAPGLLITRLRPRRFEGG